jgi:hypothetical protein
MPWKRNVIRSLRGVRKSTVGLMAHRWLDE